MFRHLYEIEINYRCMGFCLKSSHVHGEVTFHSHVPQSRSTVTFHSHVPQSRSTVTFHSHVPQSRSTVTFHSHVPQSRSTVTFHSHVTQSRSTVTLHSHVPQSRYTVTFLPIEAIEKFRSRHLHGHHAICGPPPWLHQSIIKFEFSALYPGVGGLSGSMSRKFPRYVLKLAKVFWVLTILGRTFHSLSAFTVTFHSHIPQLRSTVTFRSTVVFFSQIWNHQIVIVYVYCISAQYQF